MCGMGGGGGGGGGGFGGGGGGFGGFDFGIGNVGTGLSFGGGGDTVAAPINPITNPTPSITEGDKKFLGSKPGFSEKKMQALANRSGKSSLYIS